MMLKQHSAFSAFDDYATGVTGQKIPDALPYDDFIYGRFFFFFNLFLL